MRRSPSARLVLTDSSTNTVHLVAMDSINILALTNHHIQVVAVDPDGIKPLIAKYCHQRTPAAAFCQSNPLPRCKPLCITLCLPVRETLGPSMQSTLQHGTIIVASCSRDRWIGFWHGRQPASWASVIISEALRWQARISAPV